jgi:DNA-binding NtrC family response regulator/predicted hydrocarbon binding protein
LPIFIKYNEKYDGIYWSTLYKNAILSINDSAMVDKMKISNSSLIDFLNISPHDNSISIFDERMLVFDAVALGLLRKELIETFGVYGARNVLTRFGYAHGYRIAKMLSEKYPDFFAKLNSGATLHTICGLVNAQDVFWDESGGISTFKAIIKNSYESQQHVANFGLADDSVCWTLTGFASGYETYKRGKEFYFIETECAGKGQENCVMEGHYKDEWGPNILKSHLPFYGMESSNSILKNLAEKLSQVEKSLAKCQMNIAKGSDCHPIIVRSKVMNTIKELAYKVSKIDTSIIITGESGVGKEVIAKFIHNNSYRSNKPFIAVNCGAFSDTLLESELFGHVKGAFTGANRDHKGLFQEALGGTIFLDEIGETSQAMQVKLLRVIQEMEIRKVGESKSHTIDVRILSATNRDLAKEVELGNFRKDLYYRLKVIEINIPPLRERPEDILPLAHVFLKKFADKMKNQVTGISSAAAKHLISYSWPGNVRELQNTIERAVALSSSNFIELDDLPEEFLMTKTHPRFFNDIVPLYEVEKEYITNALELAGGDKIKASSKLGIGVSTLYKKLKEYQ